MLRKFVKPSKLLEKTSVKSSLGTKMSWFNRTESGSSAGQENSSRWSYWKMISATSLAGLCYLASKEQKEASLGKNLMSWPKSAFSSSAECHAEPEGPKRDVLTSRGYILQNPANNPIEDRFNCYQLRKADGYYCAVFDGHGGWQVADYAMQNLHLRLDELLKDAKTPDQVKQAIEQAYDEIEKELYDKMKSAYEVGFGKAAHVGACALICVIQGNKLYVANAGDCEAVLLRKTSDEKLESVKVCRPFTCNDPEEQARLKKEFPKEDDIIRCRSPDACYVKGALMPSRAFGDFRLKHPEFNFHNRPPEQEYRNPIPNYTGPYVTHKPEIREFDLTKDDAYIVLASDGVWDVVKTEEVGSLVTEKADSSKSLATELYNVTMNNYTKQFGYTREFLSQLPPGPQKRNAIDDITIVVLNLKNQAN